MYGVPCQTTNKKKCKKRPLEKGKNLRVGGLSSLPSIRSMRPYGPMLAVCLKQAESFAARVSALFVWRRCDSLCAAGEYICHRWSPVQSKVFDPASWLFSLREQGRISQW